MTTFAQLRKAALSQPESTEEGSRSSAVAFTVHRHRFASIGRGNDVQLYVPEPEADDFLATYPTADRLTRGGTPIGVRVPLGDIDGQQLTHWVRRAWLSRAPQRLVAQAATADTATAGGVGDLPKAIGRPATRALANAGITTLAQVAELAEAELRAMHGVGPKAVGVLREALSANGRAFRG